MGRGPLPRTVSRECLEVHQQQRQGCEALLTVHEEAHVATRTGDHGPQEVRPIGGDRHPLVMRFVLPEPSAATDGLLPIPDSAISNK